MSRYIAIFLACPMTPPASLPHSPCRRCQPKPSAVRRTDDRQWSGHSPSSSPVLPVLSCPTGNGGVSTAGRRSRDEGSNAGCGAQLRAARLVLYRSGLAGTYRDEDPESPLWDRSPRLPPTRRPVVGLRQGGDWSPPGRPPLSPREGSRSGSRHSSPRRRGLFHARGRGRAGGPTGRRRPGGAGSRSAGCRSRPGRARSGRRGRPSRSRRRCRCRRPPAAAAPPCGPSRWRWCR
jgi:hypothetical protein